MLLNPSWSSSILSRLNSLWPSSNPLWLSCLLTMIFSISSSMTELRWRRVNLLLQPRIKRPESECYHCGLLKCLRVRMRYHFIVSYQKYKSNYLHCARDKHIEYEQERRRNLPAVTKFFCIWWSDLIWFGVGGCWESTRKWWWWRRRHRKQLTCQVSLSAEFFFLFNNNLRIGNWSYRGFSRPWI